MECEGDEGWSDGTKEGGPYLEIVKIILIINLNMRIMLHVGRQWV